jgi:heterodisulfide reductase subunit B
MSGALKIGYYPGCTLKSKAKNLEDAALASLEALGIEYVELERWNCCGAVYSLADDDLIHHVAPVRNMIRAMEQGNDKVVTLCSQCYNTLARANLLVREDDEKRGTLNTFMDEEQDYSGEVEILHFLSFLRDHVGWEKLSKAVKVPLEGLKIAPFYGCTLLRPDDVAVTGDAPMLFQEFLEALGATPVDFGAGQECCGSYQVLANPDAEDARASKVLLSAQAGGADAVALSCPLCEYNLGGRQEVLRQHEERLRPVPSFYFTQLLAVALGLDPAVCRLELNGGGALKLLQERNFIRKED